MFSSKLRLTLAASAIATASMACGGAPDPAPATAPKQTGTTFSAKASALSQSSLGITRWHSTLEPGANAAFVLDGQDRVGRVKYLSMAFIDHQTNFVHVQVLLPVKGELVLDTKHNRVISNTLPASARPYAKGIYIDFQVAHPLHGGQTAYGLSGGWITVGVGAVITGAGAAMAFTPLAPAAPIVGEAGIAIMGIGINQVLTDTSSSPAPTVNINGDNNNVTAPPGANININGNNNVVNAAEGVQKEVQQNDPSATPPAADPSATPAQPGADSNNPAPSESMPGDPSSSENPAPGTDNSAPAADPSATEGSPLPPDDAGGNLDNVGSSTPSNDTPSGGSNDMPSSDPGGSSSGGDNGGSSSGGDNAGGGDNGGGGGDSSGSSEASHVCRKVAVSKSTKIRACIHY